jgi:hypothetical protein
LENSGSVTGGTCVSASTGPLLCYSYQDLTDLPTNYGFPPGASVVGPTGTLISNTYTGIYTSTLLQNMNGAGVISSLGAYYYTGCTGSGTVGPNCGDWNYNGFNDGYIGSSASYGSAWLDAITIECNSGYELICFCAF